MELNVHVKDVRSSTLSMSLLNKHVMLSWLWACAVVENAGCLISLDGLRTHMYSMLATRPHATGKEETRRGAEVHDHGGVCFEVFRRSEFKKRDGKDRGSPMAPSSRLPKLFARQSPFRVGPTRTGPNTLRIRTWNTAPRRASPQYFPWTPFLLFVRAEYKGCLSRVSPPIVYTCIRVPPCVDIPTPCEWATTSRVHARIPSPRARFHRKVNRTWWVVVYEYEYISIKNNRAAAGIPPRPPAYIVHASMHHVSYANVHARCKKGSATGPRARGRPHAIRSTIEFFVVDEIAFHTTLTQSQKNFRGGENVVMGVRVILSYLSIFCPHPPFDSERSDQGCRSLLGGSLYGPRFHSI